MAVLGTLRPGANDATATPNQTAAWSTIPGATDLADDSDATYGEVSTNVQGNYGESFALGDTPADFATMLTALFSVRYAWSATPTSTTWNFIDARIVSGATVLAAADSGGAMQRFVSSITATSPTTSTPASFSYVNTAADQTAWDAAIIQVELYRTKIKGGGTEGMRVHEVYVTGTYTATAPSVTANAGVAAATAAGVAASSTAETVTAGVAAATAAGIDATAVPGEFVTAGTAAATAAGVDATIARTFSTTVGEVGLATYTPGTQTNHSFKVRARVTSGARVAVLGLALYEGTTNRSGDLFTTALTTSSSSVTIVEVIALSRSGRFNVTSAMSSSISVTSMVSNELLGTAIGP